MIYPDLWQGHWATSYVVLVFYLDGNLLLDSINIGHLLLVAALEIPSSLSDQHLRTSRIEFKRSTLGDVSWELDPVLIVLSHRETDSGSLRMRDKFNPAIWNFNFPVS